MKTEELRDLIPRYIILLLLGFFNLKLFYFIFSPLTVYPVFWIVSLFDENARLLVGNLIFFEGFYAEIISACVAGAAYYLLLILNLTTPMHIIKRIKSLVFLIVVFLFLNIARILFFMGFLAAGYQYFDLAHNITWYFGSTLLVIIIWFLNVWLFKIKAIPIYTDVKRIFSDVEKIGNKQKKAKKQL